MKAMEARETKTRIALKNILFATDFSAAANAALPFATQIARRYGAKVYGVHVNTFNDYTAIAPDAWPAMAEAAEKEAQDDAQLLNEQLQGIDHEAIISRGNVWEAVSTLIKEKDIDLIVLGTRGRTGIGKALLGSMAEEILRQAPCPVLTAGPHVTAKPEHVAEVREIVYATDLAVDFPAAAPYAISLAEENQAHLALLHVIEHPKTGELVQPRDVTETKLRKLRELVPEEAELWCEPACLVEQGNAAEKILAVAEQRDADLIVLGARPVKGLLGAGTHLNAGTVHKVVSQAKCPVLTVRD
jgi:nucleotide-binding universal stress UspA family protein